MNTIRISEDIKNEIAEKLVELSSPGYSTGYMGEWFVVNGERLVFQQGNSAWYPWSDDDNVISVEDLVLLYGDAKDCDFDPSPSVDLVEQYGEDAATKIAFEAAVEFALGFVPDEYDPDAYNELRFGH